MTERAKFNLAELKERIQARDHYQCQRCGQPGTELAHKIAKTQPNIKQHGREACEAWKIEPTPESVSYWGQRITWHPLNLSLSCRGCNDSFNIGNQTAKARALAAVIRGALAGKTMQQSPAR